MSTPDGFYQGLLEVQTDLCRAFADELARVRKENIALKKTIAEFPSDMTDLQDRLVMAQQRIDALKARLNDEQGST